MARTQLDSQLPGLVVTAVRRFDNPGKVLTVDFGPERQLVVWAFNTAENLQAVLWNPHTDSIFADARSPDCHQATTALAIQQRAANPAAYAQRRRDGRLYPFLAIHSPTPPLPPHAAVPSEAEQRRVDQRAGVRARFLALAAQRPYRETVDGVPLDEFERDELLGVVRWLLTVPDPGERSSVRAEHGVPNAAASVTNRPHRIEQVLRRIFNDDQWATITAAEWTAIGERLGVTTVVEHNGPWFDPSAVDQRRRTMQATIDRTRELTDRLMTHLGMSSIASIVQDLALRETSASTFYDQAAWATLQAHAEPVHGPIVGAGRAVRAQLWQGRATLTPQEIDR